MAEKKKSKMKIKEKSIFVSLVLSASIEYRLYRLIDKISDWAIFLFDVLLKYSNWCNQIYWFYGIKTSTFNTTINTHIGQWTNGHFISVICMSIASHWIEVRGKTTAKTAANNNKKKRIEVTNWTVCRWVGIW